MTLILFVCRGNTCRSPMAEAAARATARREGIGDIKFASAGIAVATLNAYADPRAIACMAADGLDLTGHRTRTADSNLLAAATRIYTLDRSIHDHLRAIAAPELQARIQLLMHLLPALGIDEVDDPWSGTATNYDDAYSLIQQATTALIIDLQVSSAGY